ncbi:MAG: hypothetical protein QNL62_25085 [Gammaproteobacteria bacterium]|nr:hypothetical protein [Gammaproteobacteria bacterium]
MSLSNLKKADLERDYDAASVDFSSDAPDTAEFQATTFKPLRFIIIILFIIVFISQAIKWYSHSVTLPRFCADPELALHHLEQIVSQRTPAGNASRRPYIIAAKLIYLVPQQANEPVKDYIHRVRSNLNQRCRQ